MKFIDINYLKVYAISFIVVLHCFVCPISIWGLLEPTTATDAVKNLSFLLMPEANMPLFVAISGYLFYYLFSIGKPNYVSFSGILKNKAKRLLIPFLILGTIACAIIPERPMSLIVWGEGSSLWFCAMLFWCTLLRWLIKKANNKILTSTTLLVCVLVLFYYRTNYSLPHTLGFIPIGLLGFIKGLFFYPFFVLGEYLYKAQDRLRHTSIFILAIGTVIYIAYWYLAVFQSGIIARIFYPSLSLPYIVLVFALVFKLVDNRVLKPMGGVDLFCKYSFGIYVFHEPISWICYHNNCFLEIFRANPFCFAIVFTMVVMAFCFIATHYCLKTKIGKSLLS